MSSKAEILASVDGLEADLAALRADLDASWPDHAPAPDPDPIFKATQAEWPYRFRSANGFRLQGAQGDGLDISLSSADAASFGLSVGPADGAGVVGPVTYSDGTKSFTDVTPGYYSGDGFFAFASDGQYAITITESDQRETVFNITVGAGVPAPGPKPGPTPTPTPTPTPSPGPAPSGAFKSQVGPWFLARWSQEMAPLNYFKTAIPSWRTAGPRGAEIDPALIDRATGFPTALPSGGAKISTAFFFDIPQAAQGDYIAEIVGDATISLAGVTSTRVSPKRLEFSMPASNRSMSVTIDSIGPGGIQDIRIYFKKDEAALNAGELWSPRFVSEVGKYDIIRTMDLQNTNGIFVTKAVDIAPIDYAFWGATAAPFGFKQSLPLEAVFKLGVEADTEIWFQTPIALGFPWKWKDPATPGSSSIPGMLADARTNADAILDSPEWNQYADEVVSGLVAAGYPESRRLILSVSNEVWNYGSFDWKRHTEYANGIGQSRIAGGYRYREGYGILVANMAMAMDRAFARAGRNQNVEYVFEGQAVDDWRTSVTLEYAKRHVESRGIDWADFAPRTGWSIASYWGGKWTDVQDWPAWAADIAADPNKAAKKRADHILNGPGHLVGTKAWVLRQFNSHKAKAATYGVKLFGAYEGGSHDTRPAQIPAGFYASYLWGPEGARVNRDVNDALIAAHPGIVITNYGTIGAVGGDPWHEGPYGAANEYAKSWEKYQRPHP